jgi:hypothetical protein
MLPAQAPAQAPVQDVPEEEGVPATPEEQGLYDEFVTRAKSLIWDQKKEEARPEIVKSLQDGDPVEALAQTAAAVFFKVDQAATKAGMQIPEDVKMAAGEEVFSDVAQVASVVTDVDFTSDPELYDKAFLMAVDEVAQMEGGAGMVDKEAAAAELQAIDQQGGQQPPAAPPQGGMAPAVQ